MINNKNMITKPQLTPEYIKDMFGQFLSVAIKPTGLKQNVYLTGPAGCGKLAALIEILKERDLDYQIFDSTRVFGLKSAYDEVLASNEIIIIDDLISKRIDEPNVSGKLKDILETKKVILVVHSTDEERNYGYNYKSVVDRCLVFHFPQM
jgi:DNA replication protein DnaC